MIENAFRIITDIRGPGIFFTWNDFLKSDYIHGLLNDRKNIYYSQTEEAKNFLESIVYNRLVREHAEFGYL